MAVPPDAAPVVVRAANDQLRTTFEGGKVIYSEWLQELDDDWRAEITKAVMEYSYFRYENPDDKHQVHCFGTFVVRNWLLCWKIDAFAPDGTPLGELADPAASNRILTIKSVHEA